MMILSDLGDVRFLTTFSKNPNEENPLNFVGQVRSSFPESRTSQRSSGVAGLQETKPEAVSNY